MNDVKIEPALTAEEWRDALLDEEGEPSKLPSPGLVYELSYLGWVPTERRTAAAISILNAALPDSDPRKITPEMVFCLREVVANFRAAYETAGGINPQIAAQYAPAVEQLADALESYLPPG